MSSNPKVTVRLEYSGMRVERDCQLLDVPEVMGQMADSHGIDSGPHTCKGTVHLTSARAKFTVIH